VRVLAKRGGVRLSLARSSARSFVRSESFVNRRYRYCSSRRASRSPFSPSWPSLIRSPLAFGIVRCPISPLPPRRRRAPLRPRGKPSTRELALGRVDRPRNKVNRHSCQSLSLVLFLFFSRSLFLYTYICLYPTVPFLFSLIFVHSFITVACAKCHRADVKRIYTYVYVRKYTQGRECIFVYVHTWRI